MDQEYTWFSENSFVTKGAQRKTLLQTESIHGSRSLSSENAWNSKWIPATAQQSKGKGILGDLLWHHSFPASKIENSNLEYSKYQTISMFFMKDMRYYPSFFVFTPYFHHLIKKYCFQIKYCFLFYIPPLPFREINTQSICVLFSYPSSWYGRSLLWPPNTGIMTSCNVATTVCMWFLILSQVVEW